MATNNRKIKWGIWGTGRIAQDVVTALSYLPDSEIVAVGSRTKEAAEEFGKKYNIPKRVLTNDLPNIPEVEVIYISVIHPHHYESTLKCLRAGKAVLCEKPLAMNTKQTEEMIQLARDKKVFFMEGMWTRFFPSIIKLRELIDTQAIGKVQAVQGDFGFRDSGTPRLQQKELGGGALLDIGVYLVSFASMVFQGKKPQRISALGTLLPSGVDGQVSIAMKYNEYQVANLLTTICAETTCHITIFGEKGWIRVHAPFWCTTKLTVQLTGQQQAQELDFPLPAVKQGHSFNFINSIGMVYQCAHVHQCLKEGKLESPVITLQESLLIMKSLDEIRKQIGVTYSCDEEF
jgi:dihydrodiol dehydrogenase / D-xylose 1-dehydrogenase (NADP)